MSVPPRPHIQLVFFLLLVACAAGVCPAQDTGAITFTGVTMGTTYTVTLTHAGINPQVLDQKILTIVDGVDQKMSTYLDGSELSRLNRSTSTDWIAVSDELYYVLSHAVAVTEETGGAFDIGVGPLVNLWGFGPVKHATVPTATAIAEALKISGSRLIELQAAPPSVRKRHPAVYLDLSGIAKGYAVDRVAAYLTAAGVDDFMVEIGGEIRTSGVNPDGQPWHIGIEKPVTGQRVVERIIQLSAMAMATSGDYRNYFEKDGSRYSHIIDPRNGRPIAHALASVTVLERTVMRADALATALLVLGPEAGFELAQTRGLAAFFIVKTDAGFSEKYTAAFKQFLTETDGL